MTRILRRIWLITLTIVPMLILLNLLLLGLRSTDWQPQIAINEAAQYEVEIIRDEFGVPHIYGKRDVDVAFGLSFAHAEDDFKTMQQMIPFYRGELAREIGMDGAPIDFLVHWLGVREHVIENYETTLSPQIRAHLKAYADGLNYYAATHKFEADPRLFPITAQDLAVGFSLQHLLFFGFERHVTELFADSPQRELTSAPDSASLTRHIGAAGLPVGSNAFAINRNKSNDGATRIIINSHQPLTGPVAWYEAHVKSDEGWDMHGGVFPGMPFIAKGFNPNIAYGVTVNKPDLVDVYKLKLNPKNADEYMLDGTARAFETRRHWLKIKLLGNFYLPVPRTLLRAAHGPAIETAHGTYALRYAGMNEFRQPAQWMAMNKARNLTEFKKAMAIQAIVSFNFVYADRGGDIYFLHNGRIPKRAAGWDWQKYLPGDRSDLIWQEQISFEEMPQLTNPSSGYLLSTNQDPFQVTAANDNLLRENYPPELGLQTRMTNRADRGLTIFTEAGLMSEADFIAVKWDKFYDPNSRAMKYVRRIADMDFEPNSQQAEGQKLLADWNGEAAKNNRAAALGICLLSEEWKAEQAGKSAPDIAPVYDTCLEELMTAFGRLDPQWQERNRLLRGTTDLPLGGGPDTLRAIYGLPEDDGRLKAVAGDGLVIYTAWDKNGKQNAGMVHNFGAASTRPKSPHYDDQAPLYADETFRPVALNRDALTKRPHRLLKLPLD